MISDSQQKKLYATTLYVNYRTGGSGKVEVRIVADSVIDAAQRVEPLTGHYSFEVRSVVYVGKVVVQ